ncbi:MAG TPA: hypothetical protein VF530_18585 [Planctomycetota bacterium]
MRALARSLALVLLAPLAAATDWTVGPSGSGAQFSEIQPAIDAARPGDVIRVQAGTYARFVIRKPLRILADGGGPAVVAGLDFAVYVHDLRIGNELVLSGLTLRATGSLVPVLSVVDSLGTVVLHDLDLPLAETTRPGLEVRDCARVFLLASRVRGGVLGGFGATPRGACVALRSQLWIAGSELRGSDGDPSVTQQGAHGLEVEACELRVWTSRLLGGGSGNTLMGSSGHGGTGLLARTARVELYGGPGSEIRGGDGAFETTTALNYPGGPGFTHLLGCTVRQQAAQTIAGGLDGLRLAQAPSQQTDGLSNVRLLPLAYPTITPATPQAGIGTTLALNLTGSPGALQYPALSFRLGVNLASRWFEGLAVLDQTRLQVLPPVVLPAAGTLTHAVAIPPLTSLLGRTTYLQTFEVLGRRVVLSNPALVTITN